MRRHDGRLMLLLAAMLLIVGLTGCVRRRFTIRSNPPGALVFVDDQPIGATPVSTGFTYYGSRKIQLVKDGFETTTVKQTFHPPWYELPGLDFISENLWPGEVRDERMLDFQLEPQRLHSLGDLRSRAENLRLGASRGFAAPLAPSASASPSPRAPTYSPPPLGGPPQLP